MRRRLALVVLWASACAAGRSPSSAPEPRPTPGPRPIPTEVATSEVRTEPSPIAASTEVPPPRAEAATGDALSGTWAGTYVYTTRGVGGAPGGPTSVAFFAELVVEHDHVRGSVVEPNSFDDDAGGELRASIDGGIEADGTVRLTKRYDGTAGVAHAVEYVGRLDLAATRIEGTWSTSSASGRFVMKRDRPLPRVARRSMGARSTGATSSGS